VSAVGGRGVGMERDLRCCGEGVRGRRRIGRILRHYISILCFNFVFLSSSCVRSFLTNSLCRTGGEDAGVHTLLYCTAAQSLPYWCGGCWCLHFNLLYSCTAQPLTVGMVAVLISINNEINKKWGRDKKMKKRGKNYKNKNDAVYKVRFYMRWNH
jgi:hypothetical protein